jgi:hypothetical protein
MKKVFESDTVLQGRLSHLVERTVLEWSSWLPQDSVDSWVNFFHPDTCDFCGPNHFILYHGEVWFCQPRPAQFKLGKFGRCGQNSMNLALKHSELIYVEGVVGVNNRYQLVPHSWTADRNRRIIDPTWEVDDENVYFGVPFKTSYLRQVRAKGLRASLIENWQDGFPLICGLSPRIWKARLAISAREARRMRAREYCEKYLGFRIRS